LIRSVIAFFTSVGSGVVVPGITGVAVSDATTATLIEPSEASPSPGRRSTNVISSPTTTLLRLSTLMTTG